MLWPSHCLVYKEAELRIVHIQYNLHAATACSRIPAECRLFLTMKKFMCGLILSYDFSEGHPVHGLLYVEQSCLYYMLLEPQNNDTVKLINITFQNRLI